jgi:hypothetical protein
MHQHPALIALRKDPARITRGRLTKNRNCKYFDDGLLTRRIASAGYSYQLEKRLRARKVVAFISCLVDKIPATINAYFLCTGEALSSVEISVAAL